MRGNRVERFNDVINITSGASSGAVAQLLDNYLVNINGGAVRMTKDGNVVVGGNVISGTMTNGLVLTNGATINVFSKGGNVGVPAGGWLTRQVGTEVVNLFADDFEVDISMLARVNNARCINTNAALGTLGALGAAAASRAKAHLQIAGVSWATRQSSTDPHPHLICACQNPPKKDKPCLRNRKS